MATLRFLYRQFFLTPTKADPNSTNLKDQTGIVTGSNIGLGLEASRQLLELGLSHLILAVRDQKKGEAARQDLSRTSPEAKIEVWDLNLSNYQSVQEFVQRCSTLPRLDFAILNAGLLRMQLEINKTTGHEETIQVNYLSTALLAILLIPVLQAKRANPGKPGRITIVSSEMGEFAQFREQMEDPILPAFNDPKYFDTGERYATSKLLEQFFVASLVQRVPGSKAVVNLVNPGLCYGTGFHTEFSGALKFFFGLFKRAIGRSTSVGARTLVYAAVVAGDESHGKYTSDCRITNYILTPILGIINLRSLEKHFYNPNYVYTDTHPPPTSLFRPESAAVLSPLLASMRGPKRNLLGPLKPNQFYPPCGQKKVYLPNFTLTLLRTPFAPPNYATFLTPLNLNKFDIKDYLYHLYGVQVLSVRSYVQQARVRHGKPGARLPKRGFYRPRATKRMTVEMPTISPFVWPEAPTDFSPWDKEAQEKAEEARDEEQKLMGPEGRTAPKADAKKLREQAEELLKGKRAWRPGWMDWGVTGRARGEVGAGLGMAWRSVQHAMDWHEGEEELLNMHYSHGCNM
ncbi:MAG: hypothetical protein LQ338_001537 [Usnochroma carphineum]|nr:MAG: hypothetical protein LQ338_001537 [Usnochroma carphineum]